MYYFFFFLIKFCDYKKIVIKDKNYLWKIPFRTHLPLSKNLFNPIVSLSLNNYFYKKIKINKRYYKTSLFRSKSKNIIDIRPLINRSLT